MNDLMTLVVLLLNVGLIGAVMPPIVSVIVRSSWPSWGKALVALGTSALVGTGTAWAAGALAGLTWPLAVMAALVASQVAYRKWWHATGIAQWIERMTQPVIEGQVVSSTTVEQ